MLVIDCAATDCLSSPGRRDSGDTVQAWGGWGEEDIVQSRRLSLVYGFDLPAEPADAVQPPYGH